MRLRCANFLVVLLWALPICAQNWTVFSSELIFALRAQRDLMKNVSIDQLPLPGVSLKPLVFDRQKNGTLALEEVSELLNHGVQTFQLDLSYGSDENWYMEGSATKLDSVLEALQRFVQSSNNNLNANILTILLRFDKESMKSGSGIKTTNFTQLLEQTVNGGLIYTSNDLKNDRALNLTWDSYGVSKMGWVSLNRFLFEVKKRFVFGFLNGDDFISDDLNSFIFPSNTFHYVTDNSTISCPLKTVSEISNVSELQWRFLEGTYENDQVLNYVECGYSLIIGNTIDSIASLSFQQLLSNLLSWSWNSSDPVSRLVDTSPSESRYIAYRCGVFAYESSQDNGPWKTGNCYDPMPVLCRYRERAYMWNLSNDDHPYFQSVNKDICPDGYELGIPRTPLQQRSLKLFLKEEDIRTTGFWIDINSIAVDNCWVTGGPYAKCPYQTYGSKRSYILMTVPAAVVAFVLLMVMFHFNLVRVPIQDNRNSWKRIINAYSKEEVEGVPS